MGLAGGSAMAAPAAAEAVMPPFSGAYAGGPPLPAINELFHAVGAGNNAPPAAPVPSQKPPVPTMARALPPVPDRNPLYSGDIFAEDMPPMLSYHAPSSIAGANDSTKSPYDLARDAGQTTDTIFASPVDSATGAPGETEPAYRPSRGGSTTLPKSPTSQIQGFESSFDTGPVQANTESAEPAEPEGFLAQIQDRLKKSPGNPLFQVGMGLLSSGYSGSDPYAAINKNLGGIQAYETGATKAEKEATDLERLREFERMMMEMSARYGGAAGAIGGSATPQGSNQAAGAARVIR